MIPRFLSAGFFLIGISLNGFAEDMRAVPLKSRIEHVQPMTGIVLWTTNERVDTAPIQLEYSYMTYSQVVVQRGNYDWQAVDELLESAAARGHQVVLRWHDTYVGKKTGVPAYIRSLEGYKTTTGKSENKSTEFPDWSHPELQRFALEFFSEFAKRYDDDPRLAFVQVGFGLWAEYHIYDGPMVLGVTFPSKEFQSQFVRHLAGQFHKTPWMISVDAADNESTPFEGNQALLDLPFGVFDDSFNHKKHSKENEPNWETFGADRWQRSPAGGEFSFFERVDQTKALSVQGPHGIPFEKQAAKFHVSFIIGDAQPDFQSAERIEAAGMACGYRFRVTSFETNSTRSKVIIENTGVAPIYYDAYPSINGIRASASLKGLLPGESRTFGFDTGGRSPMLSIDCDRLVPGQRIQFEADLD